METKLTKTVGELLRELTQLLHPAAEDLAEREAETIIEHLLNLSYSEIRIKSKDTIENDLYSKALSIAKDRLSGKPLPYVLGSSFFYSKDFVLSSETLTPRHDTEHLVAHILEKEPASPALFLELGTGSGIIPAILTEEDEDWRGISVDIFPETLKTAQKNCNSESVFLLASDSFSSITPKKQFNFIVSNPPYIPTKTVKEELDDSVRHYEPHRALDGGEDGLDFYRYLAQVSREYLIDGGFLYLEIGFDQGKTVPQLLKDSGATEIRVIQDFANRDRVVVGKF